MIICIIPGLSAICQRSRSSSSDRGGQKLGWERRIFLSFFSTFETILTSFLSFSSSHELFSTVSLCVYRVCASLPSSRRLFSCSTSFFPGRGPLWCGDRRRDGRGSREGEGGGGKAPGVRMAPGCCRAGSRIGLIFRVRTGAFIFSSLRAPCV